MNEARLQSWVWRNLELRLPPDWELLQFSRNPDQGRCAFADRYAFRFELSWRTAAPSLDLERMIADYLAALESEGMKEGTRRVHGPWLGLDGLMAGQRMTRYGRFIEAEACVVEAVFLWRDRRAESLEGDILDSIAPCAPLEDGSRVWRAFGMQVRAPAGLVLASASALPAHAEMRFASAGAGPRAVFARRGMVRQWLRTPLADWLANWLQDEGAGTGSPTREEQEGHTIQGRHGSFRAGGLIKRNQPCAAEAWICPRDGRLYSWFATGETPSPGIRPLACCEEWGP